MRRALMFVVGAALGAWLGSAWERSVWYGKRPARPFGEHERLTDDASLRVLRQPGPGRVAHYRSA